MSHRATATNQGFVLIIVTLVVSTLTFVAGYFLEQSVDEIKISSSDTSSNRAYYLAEAGAQEAIFKLKNDNAWKTDFVSGTISKQFTRDNALGTTGSYTITATALQPGLVDIVVTATIPIGNQTTKRVIKTRLDRATVSGNPENLAFYSGDTSNGENGNLTVERNCTINGGTWQANQTLKVTSSSIVTANNTTVRAKQNIIVNSGSTLKLTGTSTKIDNSSIAISVPALDIDSNSPYSLKNRRTQIYSANNFNALPSGTVLNGITYVSGSINWINKNLTINGLLVASGNITISLNAITTSDNNNNIVDDESISYISQFKKIFSTPHALAAAGEKDSFIGTTPTSLIINSHALGSGLIAKNSIFLNIENNSNIVVNGLLDAYSSQFTLTTKNGGNFTVNGALMGWRVKLQGDDAGYCQITYNSSLANFPLDPAYNDPNYSPIIKANHWEEQY